jgi:hypothetical protein
MHQSVGSAGEEGNPLASFHDQVEAEPSSRSFGFLFTVVFALIGVTPWLRGGPVRLWAIAVAGILGLTTLAAPRVLAPLSRLWLRIGLAMHRVVNPLVMGALFYLVVTPFGLVRQAMNKGLTPRLVKDPRASTYWITRAGQPASRMDQQF